MEIKLYHGSTSALPITTTLLPACETGIKREDWRRKYTDCVFLTSSLKSAEMYAKKASAKYGGNPVVYEAKPIGQLIHISGTEYTANKAKIIQIRQICQK